MSGGSMVGLVLLSMAWLFFAGGAVMNFSVMRRARRAKTGALRDRRALAVALDRTALVARRI
jgi:hypothetical protein